MEDWREYELSELLAYEQPSAYIVKSTNYDDSYSTPVLTAGKSFILGYTNETNGICTKYPLIVFDDFTTSTQYVDFSFKVKSSALKILHPNLQLVLPKFIYYRLQIINFDHSTHKRYWIQHYSKQKIKIPTLAEQERIVAKIEELFSEIDKIEETLLRTSKQLIQYKQAILKYAFSTIEHGNPSTLGEVLQNKPRNGFSPKAVAHETPYKNLTLTSTTGGVFRDGFYKYIELDIDKDSYLWVKRNDILIQRANTIDYVGTAALYTGEDNQYVYPDLMMKCRTKAGILPSFIVYQLQSQNCKIHFRKHATGTSGSMPKINQQTVISTPIVIADIHIQEKVVQHIEQQLSACTNIELTFQRTQEQLKSLRRSILKQAFEGNLV